MNKYVLRNMLEKALYFYVEHCSEEELKEQEEWYNLLTEEHFNCDLEEELIDNMFESYLENYYIESDLIERINDLFELDNVSDYDKLIAYRNFLEQENNYDLFELKTQNRIKGYKGCVAFLKDKEHLLKVFEGSENGEEDSIVDYDTFIKNYDFKLEVI